MELLKVICKRFVNGILVMFGVVLIVFLLFNILPVNSARMTLGQRADMASVAAIEKEFRLNLPAGQRLLLYLNDLSPISFHKQENPDAPSYLNADEVKFTALFTVGSTTVVAKWPYLGKSFQYRKKVSDILGEKIFPTFLLAIIAMAIASLFGIVLGVFAAIKQYSVWDNIILTFSTLGISQPAFFAGIILAIIFGFYLGEYTHLGVTGSLIDLDPYTGEPMIIWKNLILPVAALSVRPIAIITQLTRASMLDSLSQDYIRTARAKGLGYYTVIFKHALRNAMNPVVTSISGWLAALLTGAFFIESVFHYDGLGLTTISSILSFDFPVVMGSVLLVALVFVVMNMLTDILYSVLDPRVTVK